jgi:putative transposase
MPVGDADFSGRWGAIKARFSMSVRRAGFTPPPAPTTAQRLAMAINGGVNPARRKGQVGIWQKRFWEHMIRDERDYRNHVEYCWDNPVKHGFVERAVDWPFSSIHREITRGLLSSEWDVKKTA